MEFTNVLHFCIMNGWAHDVHLNARLYSDTAYIVHYMYYHCISVCIYNNISIVCIQGAGLHIAGTDIIIVVCDWRSQQAKPDLVYYILQTWTATCPSCTDLEKPDLETWWVTLELEHAYTHMYRCMHIYAHAHTHMHAVMTPIASSQADLLDSLLPIVHHLETMGIPSISHT